MAAVEVTQTHDMDLGRHPDSETGDVGGLYPGTQLDHVLADDPEHRIMGIRRSIGADRGHDRHDGAFDGRLDRQCLLRGALGRDEARHDLVGHHRVAGLDEDFGDHQPVPVGAHLGFVQRHEDARCGHEVVQALPSNRNHRNRHPLSVGRFRSGPGTGNQAREPEPHSAER